LLKIIFLSFSNNLQFFSYENTKLTKLTNQYVLIWHVQKSKHLKISIILKIFFGIFYFCSKRIHCNKIWCIKFFTKNRLLNKEQNCWQSLWAFNLSKSVTLFKLPCFTISHVHFWSALNVKKQIFVLSIKIFSHLSI